MVFNTKNMFLSWQIQQSKSKQTDFLEKFTPASKTKTTGGLKSYWALNYGFFKVNLSTYGVLNYSPFVEPALSETSCMSSCVFLCDL